MPGSLYHDVIYPGGVKTTERGEIDSWPDIAAMTSGGSIDADAEFAANRAHPTFDDYWRDRSFVDVLDRVTVPVLAVGGWNDHFFRSGTLANIEAIPDPDVGDLRVVGALLPGRAQRRVERGRPATASARPDAGRQSAAAVRRAARLVRPLGGRPMPMSPIPNAPTFVSFEGPVGVGRRMAGTRPMECSVRCGPVPYGPTVSNLGALVAGHGAE